MCLYWIKIWISLLKILTDPKQFNSVYLAMWFCFSICDFIYSNLTISLFISHNHSFIITHRWNHTSISSSPSGSISIWKCPFISLIYISLRLRWLYCVGSDICSLRAGLRPSTVSNKIHKLSLFSHAVSLRWSNFTHADSRSLTLQLPGHLSMCLPLDVAMDTALVLLVAFRLQFLTGIGLIIRCVMGCIWQVFFLQHTLWVKVNSVTLSGRFLCYVTLAKFSV